MSSVAVSVQGLGKKYKVAGSSAPYGTLRDSVSGIVDFSRWPRRNKRRDAATESEVWVLKDVDFELEHGNVLGIIGRNGAGKSTLLKILSRITEPTVGQAQVRGRVGSLLEVGTGFHPELSGRENIFLNGAILGMSRADIIRRFDEIVEFSGVARYLDTPVKYYSSGMYMRLAFSVAAHLEPEVLVVDEVLAVGDAEFQRKCIGKMSSVASEGRTVIFVSHNMAAVQNLCNQAVLLESGQVLFSGTTSRAVDLYLRPATLTQEGPVDLTNAVGRHPGMRPVCRKLTVRDETGRCTFGLPCGEGLIIELEYEHSDRLVRPDFGIVLQTSDGIPVAHLTCGHMSGTVAAASSTGRATCVIDALPLVPGTYFFTVGCKSGEEQLDLIHEAAQIEIYATDFFGTGRLPDSRNGFVLLSASWQLTDDERVIALNPDARTICQVSRHSRISEMAHHAVDVRREDSISTESRQSPGSIL